MQMSDASSTGYLTESPGREQGRRTFARVTAFDVSCPRCATVDLCEFVAALVEAQDQLRSAAVPLAMSRLPPSVRRRPSSVAGVQSRQPAP
jgi:hypothetical protein